jgi:hypothetical protein
MTHDEALSIVIDRAARWGENAPILITGGASSR